MYHHSIKVEIFGTNFYQPELSVLSNRKHHIALIGFQHVVYFVVVLVVVGREERGSIYCQHYTVSLFNQMHPSFR